jgi:hypothetical protein
MEETDERKVKTRTLEHQGCGTQQRRESIERAASGKGPYLNCSSGQMARYVSKA